MVRLAGIESQQGDANSATDLLRAALREDPHLSEASLRLARLHIASSDLESAAAVLEAAVRSAPANELLLLEYEFVLKELGLSERAAEMGARAGRAAARPKFLR